MAEGRSLQEVVATRRRELDLTYEDLMAAMSAAKKHPFTIKRTQLGHWLRDQWDDAPPTDLIMSLAEVLELDPQLLWQATGTSVGIQERELLVTEHTKAVHVMMAPRSPKEQEAMRAAAASVVVAIDQAVRDALRTAEG